ATAAVAALVTDHAVTVPDLIPGTNYHFRVKSRDQCNRETASGDRVFSTGPAPDLQVTSITAPAAVWTGRAFDVAWAVTNASSAPASGSWRDRVYLCSSAPPCTTYLLGEFPYTIGLAATSSVTRVQSVTIDRTQVTDGNYYLTVVVDALNEIHEGLPGSRAETNNTAVSAQPVQVQLTPLPDLVVSQVVAPTNSVYGGQQISVRWIVCNIGQAFTDAPQWHDHVRLYSDPNRTTLVKDFGEFVNPSYLGTNECYDQTAALVLPVGISGSHYLVVETDSRNEVFESNEANNRGQVSNPIPVIYVAPPFLHVSSVTVAPAPPTTVWGGDQLTVTWTVKNTGGTPMVNRSWDHAIAFSPNDAWSSAFVTLFHLEGVSLSLGPGESYTKQHVVTAPANTMGTNYVIVVVDPPGGTGVQRDTGAAMILANPPPPADLEVTSVSAPATGVAGQRVDVRWVVANNGLASTHGGAWRDSVYLSPSPVFNSGIASWIGYADRTVPLEAGSTYTNAASVLLPGNISGGYYLFVYADINNAIFEAPWETNNVSAPRPIEITYVPPPQPPDLQVMDIQAPSSAVGGLARNISWIVQNTGESDTSTGGWVDSVYLSSVGALGQGQTTLLGNFAHSTALTAGARYTNNVPVTIPPCAVGTFYVVVTTDSTNRIAEGVSGETNNSRVAASPTTVVPSQLARLNVNSVAVPAAATAGQPMTVNWFIANVGSTPASGPWTDAIFLSAHDYLNTSSDLLLGTLTYNVNLRDGQTVSNSFTGLVPPCASGAMYVFVVTDYSNQVNSAACETNNTLHSSSTVAITATPYPALRLFSFQVADPLPSGSLVPVTWVVTNTGNAVAEGDWVDALYLSSSSAPSINLLVGQITNQGPLAAGAGYIRTQMVPTPACYTGAFSFCVVVDRDHQINAAACAANSSACAQTHLQLSFPDLTVAGITKPSLVSGGTPFQVGWTVFNAGNLPATGPWTEVLYRSSSPSFNLNTAVPLYTNIAVGTLVPGQSQDRTANLVLPPSLGGNFYLVVALDTGNVVPECSGEGNNIAPSQVPLQVVPSQYPDLSVTAVQAPATAIGGQPMQVSWTVANVGTYATPAIGWYDAVYLSKDQIFDPASDVKLGAFTRPQALGIGQSYTNTLLVDIPPGAAGPYFLIVVADSSGLIDLPWASANNVLATPVATVLSLAPPSDLAMTSVSTAAASGLPGDSITVNWTVRNVSTNRADGRWTDALYLSPTPVLGLDAILIGQQDRLGPVQPGASYTANQPVTLPAATPGNYYLLARADVRNNVREYSKANNTAASTTTLFMDVPVLVLGQPRTNSLTTGAKQYYKLQVPDDQTVAIVLDSQSQYSANELYVRRGALPDLGVYDYAYSQPLAADQRVVVPNTQAGWYYILVRGASVPDAPAQFTLQA
ncbi:MAG: CARDB domain-containing protein, partial [Verrucomicrobiota bacterium]